MEYIDINCDVGEGVGNEAELMPLISSCNIACGGHAGDFEIMYETAQLAKQYGVKIGAHPSYPDKENFGRKVMHIAPEELKASIKEQLTDFLRVLDKVGARMHHIKPHGALYNQIAKHEVLANVFLDVLEELPKVPLFVPFDSKIQEEAKKERFKC